MGLARLQVVLVLLCQALHLLHGVEGESVHQSVLSLHQKYLYFSSLSKSQFDDACGEARGRRRAADLRGPAPEQSHSHVEERH